jgi:hypothetical protein
MTMERITAWLGRTSWWRFGDGHPKREAHLIVLHLLAENERLRAQVARLRGDATLPDWVTRVGSNTPRKPTA